MHDIDQVPCFRAIQGDSCSFQSLFNELSATFYSSKSDFEEATHSQTGREHMIGFNKFLGSWNWYFSRNMFLRPFREILVPLNRSSMNWVLPFIHWRAIPRSSILPQIGPETWKIQHSNWLINSSTDLGFLKVFKVSKSF